MDTLPKPALANISFVTDRLAVGGDLAYDDDLAARQVEELLTLGVTHIVDVRIEWSDEDLVAELAPSITYHHLGIDDAGQEIDGEWFDAGVRHIRDALAHADSIAVAHCHMGINRGPSLGFAALLADGWDPVDAAERIRRARPIAYIGYAEDALRWHHDRTNAAPGRRRDDRKRLAAWRHAHDLDVADVIRGVRRLEGRGVALTPEHYDQLSSRSAH